VWRVLEMKGRTRETVRRSLVVMGRWMLWRTSWLMLSRLMTMRVRCRSWWRRRRSSRRGKDRRNGLRTLVMMRREVGVRAKVRGGSRRRLHLLRPWRIWRDSPRACWGAI
ncbi:hypothetical protein LTS18_007754, partial [Coniosporium uncinatum]